MQLNPCPSIVHNRIMSRAEEKCQGHKKNVKIIALKPVCISAVVRVCECAAQCAAMPCQNVIEMKYEGDYS